MSELGRRVLVAVGGIPLTVALVYLGGGWLVALLALLAGLGAWELYRLAERGDLGPISVLGVPIAAALPLYAWLAGRGLLAYPVTLGTVVFLALLAASLWARGPDHRPLVSVSVTACGAAYVGGTLSFALLLRHHRFVVDDAAGAALVLFPVAVTWATDVGAYFVGRVLGGPKLMPSVSPGKTVAGAAGGTLAAVAASVIYGASVLPRLAQLTLSPTTAIVFGFVIAAAAQVGDLFESMLKRSARVKDSSNLLPGHGGILDRLDSLYFVLPVAHLLLNRLLAVVPPPR